MSHKSWKGKVLTLFTLLFYHECFLFILSSLLGFQLTEADQELYKDFPLVISERWQQEISETVFEAINQEADRLEAKKRAKRGDEGGKDKPSRL